MLAAVLSLGVLLPSVELGQKPAPPAQIAGPWEDLVAPQKVAGFSLEIITKEDGTVGFLRLDTYVREQGKTKRTYWSSGTSNPGTLALRSGRLSFRQPSNIYSPFDVALDLSYDSSKSAWKGSFQNPNFSGQVVLRRPSLTSSSAPAGTWRTYSYVSIDKSGRRGRDYACTNIGVGEDGALVLWSESGGATFLGTEPINGVFGELNDDSHAERYANDWSFTAGTSLGGDKVTGALSSDGSSFGGYLEHFGNGLFDPSHPQRPFVWTRMPNFSCGP